MIWISIVTVVVSVAAFIFAVLSNRKASGAQSGALESTIRGLLSDARRNMEDKTLYRVFGDSGG
jgi:hypothetical protein